MPIGKQRVIYIHKELDNCIIDLAKANYKSVSSLVVEALEAYVQSKGVEIKSEKVCIGCGKKRAYLREYNSEYFCKDCFFDLKITANE